MSHDARSAGVTSADDVDTMDAQLTDHVEVASAARAVLPTLRVLSARLKQAFAAGGHLYTFGNGGSAADAQHLTGELIGHYRRDRRPLPAVTLSTDPTVISCIANDYNFSETFSRQVEALVRDVDVVIGFTTSGNSANVVRALGAAQARGATTVLFSGRDGGLARASADFALVAPSTETARIQEMHTLWLHLLSEDLDAWAESAGQGSEVPEPSRSTGS